MDANKQDIHLGRLLDTSQVITTNAGVMSPSIARLQPTID
jgi:hypothetical protein